MAGADEPRMMMGLYSTYPTSTQYEMMGLSWRGLPDGSLIVNSKSYQQDPISMNSKF